LRYSDINVVICYRSPLFISLRLRIIAESLHKSICIVKVVEYQYYTHPEPFQVAYMLLFPLFWHRTLSSSNTLSHIFRQIPAPRAQLRHTLHSYDAQPTSLPTSLLTAYYSPEYSRIKIDHCVCCLDLRSPRTDYPTFSPFVRLWLWLETFISLVQLFCHTIGHRTHAVQYIDPVNWRSRPFAQHTATALLVASPTFVPSTFLDSRTYQLVTRLFRTIFSTCRSSFCSFMTSSRHAMASGGWAGRVRNYLYCVECSNTHTLSWDERIMHSRIIFLTHRSINFPSYWHSNIDQSLPLFSTSSQSWIETLYFPGLFAVQWTPDCLVLSIAVVC